MGRVTRRVATRDGHDPDVRIPHMHVPYRLEALPFARGSSPSTRRILIPTGYGCRRRRLSPTAGEGARRTTRLTRS
jgi:hypothetical protein